MKRLQTVIPLYLVKDKCRCMGLESGVTLFLSRSQRGLILVRGRGSEGAKSVKGSISWRKDK